MRLDLHAALLSTALLVLGSAGIVAGGHRIIAPEAVDWSQQEEVDLLAGLSAGIDVASAPQPDTVRTSANVAARAVEPEAFALPQVGSDDLHREEPRRPLSELSLALPPKPKADAEWEGSTLFRPVAIESAVVEAMGRKVSIAGTVSVAPGEMCATGAGRWPCGMQARTAFRMWLRGRALICALPEQSESSAVAAPCRIGRQDAGAWLVANGWARAADATYADASAKAEKERRGVFGDGRFRAPVAAVEEPLYEVIEP